MMPCKCALVKQELKLEHLKSTSHPTPRPKNTTIRSTLHHHIEMQSSSQGTIRVRVKVWIEDGGMQ